jgi:hypothetical protein
MNIEDFFNDPNGPAYQKEEKRVGPPLDYIAEKLRNSIESHHEVLRITRECILIDLPREPCYSDESEISIKEECLEFNAMYGFHNAVIAFLALYNMLGSAAEADYTERLSKIKKNDLDKWLDFVEREGSINGQA